MTPAPALTGPGKCCQLHAIMMQCMMPIMIMMMLGWRWPHICSNMFPVVTCNPT